MSSRTKTGLILALALAFVGAVLLRFGVIPTHAPSPVASDPAASVADSLPAPPAGLTWIGEPTPATAAYRAIVVWNLADPVSLAAGDRAEQWRLLYGSLGLRVVGVHAPHAAFDADSAVVAAEVARRGWTFPIALDGTLAWTHALSSAGPRPLVVIADSLGRVRYSGNDARAAEDQLESLVVAAHPEMAGADRSNRDTTRAAATIGGDAPGLVARHATVWLGAGDHPAGPLADVTPGGPRTFHAELSTEIGGTMWVPTPIGLWSLGADGLTAARGGAQQYVALRYDGGPLAVVAGAPRGTTIRMWLLRDDAWLPREACGADVRSDGRGASYVDVSGPRLYELLQPDGRTHVIKLSPEEPGLTLHAFVFAFVPPIATARP